MSERKTITIPQYETGLNWSPLVAAAGLLHDSHHPFQIYQLAGAVMRDEIVAFRASQLAAASDELVVYGAYERVLRDMSDGERAALKARIVAKFSRK